MNTVRLGDLVTSVGGGTPAKGNAAFYSGTIPWVTPKDMRSWEISDSRVHITEPGLANSAARLVPPGSVLVVVRSGILKHSLPVALTSAPVAINQDMRALIPGRSLHPRYLAHLLRAKAPMILGWVRATTADNFPSSRLMDLEIALPAPDEQRRVARILDAAEGIRSVRRRTLDALDELRTAMLSGLLRSQHLPRTLFGGLLTAPLGNGLSPATAGTHPGCVLTLSALSRGGFDERARKECFFDRPPAARQIVERGTFLVSRGNGNLRLVGAGAVVPTDLPGVAFPDTMIAAKLDDAKVTAEYLDAVWGSPEIRDQIERVATTTNGTFKINQTKLAAIEVPLPSMTAQTEFAAKAARIAAQRRRAEEHLSELDALFSSLQHRAFTDEL